MSRKKLVFLYIEDTDGFKAQGLNFSTEEKMKVNRESDGKLTLILESDEKKVPKNFFGVSISEMNLLVGENRSGKTTILRIICRWICELSNGNYPREKGILVFKEGERLSYAAFENKKELEINTENITIDIFPIKRTGYFYDFKLIYYTNTLTELGITGYKILLDRSYLQRIKEANMNGHAMGEEIITNYKRYEFDTQLSVALSMNDFPIQYILLELRKVSFEDFDILLSTNKKDIIEDLSGLWKHQIGSIFENDEIILENEKLLIYLLYIIFHDMIKKLLTWEKGVKGNKVEKALYNITKGNETRTTNFYDGIKWIQRFLEDLLYECNRIYKDSIYESEFENYWGVVCQQVIEFINCLPSGQNQNWKWIYDFFILWRPVYVQDNGFKEVWKIKLKGNEEIFNKFWKRWRRIFLFMDNVCFYWNASSGEQNWVNMLPALSIPENVQNVWFLIDEPDNTFHPEWERKLVKEIINIMDKSENCQKQIWITTHSPIMLSDMPGPSVNCLVNDISKNEKKVTCPEYSTFGQNIYCLYNDAFFLKQGIMGEFASKKIIELIIDLQTIEKKLLYKKKRSETIKYLEENIHRCEEIAKLVEVSVYSEEIQKLLDYCRALIKKEKRND